MFVGFVGKWDFIYILFLYLKIFQVYAVLTLLLTREKIKTGSFYNVFLFWHGALTRA